MNQDRINFATEPGSYKHWKLSVDGRVARLALDVDESAGLLPGYELKLNSYDLGVDIELYDAVQRLRFEHPEVAAVIIASDKPRVFCAGANIQMLGQSNHALKVNFCKFTNETRNSIEDATANSGQTYICAINGTAAGGGYELALACQHIMLVDDGSTAVSLPELPQLAVLPGTGGLTRLVDKRGVRHDQADFFCTTSEGIRGRRALDWLLVDELVAASSFDQDVIKRAQSLAEYSDRPSDAIGVELTPLNRRFETNRITYDHLSIELEPSSSAAYITIHGPKEAPPSSPVGLRASFWPLALARELDDAILHLRLNEDEIGTWVFRTLGDNELVEAMDEFLHENADDWLVREIILYLKRTLKRLDVSSRSLIALIEPGSCFSGTLLEMALASDRTFMLDGTFEGTEIPEASVRLSPLNFGALPMVNGLSRLESRFLTTPETVEKLKNREDRSFDASEAEEAGLVTFIPDDIDWEDEVRLAIEERASFSPDALTGMEASLRFAGPETMESKIFARLSAWQ
ncbi:MAG TPA: benzoyl-CoA-dihydrodiol lyase, partial [Dehalococcoidia bacterium]|nr:benzoyl-CoA-dihydrodiol lyase [Dehalococcoidia bacterium]